ncbi:hypothetical protein [Micromonospora sp. AKA38]|uniref:hypothetical protein n=1 Tax=Micromonospora sp. AKA38 TaxID=2733861 RepID=UPI0022BE39D9|nr:hypothetical protein [Micromonospora sp. AKA38]GHJ18171.1 hypothetical protein TPA0908_61660 [Micromonospora sp. AKA38]
MDEGLDATPPWLRQDAPVLAALREWAASKGGTAEVLPQEEPRRGYTAAYLFAISLGGPTGPGLTGDRKKLVKVHPAGESESPESGRHNRAKAEGGGFAKRHMVKDHHGWQRTSDDRHLSFQDVANGGDPVVAMDEIEDDDLLVAACRKVVTALPTDWNRPTKDGGPSTTSTTVREYVERELTVTKSLEAIRSAADRLRLGDLDGDWLDIDGRMLPNPLRLAEPDGLFGDLRIRYLVGRTHGDLHGGNLLIPATVDGTPQPSTFFMIDLESYESRASLSRDPAALLMSMVLRWVAPRPGPDGAWPPGLPPRQTEPLLRYLVRPDQPAPSQLPRALADIVRLTHEAGLAYADNGNWRPEWRTQFRLSLIVHALATTTYDNVSPDGVRWCFRLAAYLLEAHREEHHRKVTPPASGIGVPSPRPLDTARPSGWYQLPGGGHDPGTPGRHRATLAQPRNAAPALDPGPAGRPPHQRNRNAAADRVGGMWRSRVGRPSAGNGTRRRIMVPVTLAVFGTSLLPLMAAEGPSDRGIRPPVTPSNRTETPPTSRDDDRAGTPFEPVGPGVQLDRIAARVAQRSEPPSRGRYAHICLRVWSPNDLEPHSDRPDRFREERFWWTREGTGRRTVQAVEHGRRSRAKVSPLGPSDLTDVPPSPSEDPAELRAQVASLLDARPPELRNAAGLLELVAEFHQFWPLSVPQRVTLLRLLARTEGTIDSGSYPDRAGRDGYAISADNGEGQRETLQFDEKTGRLLSHEKIGAGNETLASYLFLDSGRTSTIVDRPCADPKPTNKGG